MTTPTTIDPYWEIIRHLPHEDSGILGDGVTPYGYARGLERLMRQELAVRFAWAIPTPGDMDWLTRQLEGRAVVEVGAGTGYWAWQAAQAGIDVIAYEPTPLADNTFAGDVEYFPLERADAVTAAGRHPDRALLMSWPGYGTGWAAEALAAYGGDAVVYVGEPEGGCCADDAFFAALDGGGECLGYSPFHRTWWGIHCRMAIFRRSS